MVIPETYVNKLPTGYQIISFVNSKSPIGLRCPGGHEYTITRRNLRPAHQCPICKSKDHNVAISKKKGVFKISQTVVKEVLNKDGYELISEYQNAKEKITVRCPYSHEYQTLFNTFRHGKRCQKCYQKNRLAGRQKLDIVLKKAGFTLVNDNLVYTKGRVKFLARCNNGHEFETSYSYLAAGKGCPHCLHRITPEFLEEPFASAGYKLIDFTSYAINRKVRIECDRGHVYDQLVSNFINNGHRCPYCARIKSFSKAETDILNKLHSICSTFVHRYRLAITKEIALKHNLFQKSIELDLYDPVSKTAIEYCGLYWHSTLTTKYVSDNVERIKILQDLKIKHRRKLEICQVYGIRLFTVFEDEWIHKQSIVIHRLKHHLDKKQCIYARQCRVQKLEDKSIIQEFFNEYHLQGYTNYKFAMGLYFHEELIGVLSIGHPSRTHTNPNGLEIKRLAFKKNVVGGASRLWQHAKKLIESEIPSAKSVISFCDLRYGTGLVYEKLGFKLLSVSKPSPHAIYRQQRRSVQTLIGNPNKTKYGLIWDCGHQKWIYEL